MKRMAAALILGAVSLSLVGCSSDYIMSTKNGEMIVTQGKPEIDKDTGMTRYVDQQGYSRQIKTADVSQLIEKD
ncbi:YgdI/YgdR family lipoprotein [Pseudescherichia vulneris]|uniref:YgdI/YgdR family lipoprotein n=1 Tax=Pseudescherichia vulneris TaxID=566 RepID=UPI0012AB7C51|nr:YgdI/YgdR family lipoprotein [Pseudescherichia vulneris]MDU5454834.1 YgdI/YgdR family lipoprotein [Pseudescherichia vulneris]